ncbi:LLM class flavin-dependent oxidoreductase [Actinophytocola sp.]|uniref:LLM class flavin-dependent oxidoreductase n=1 Tax=Actinophytocola sp. TaxID=1872138 RepID=UPI002ED2A5DC
MIAGYGWWPRSTRSGAARTGASSRSSQWRSWYACGRLIVGLGSGFNSPATERQFTAAGVPFTGRVGRLTETIEVLRAVWSGKPLRYGGEHFTFDDFVLSPAPPIWLAGAGATAETRAGRLADGWLLYLPDVRSYAEGWHRVRAAAQGPTPTAGL